MASGESAQPIYTLLEELEDSKYLVLTALINYMSGDDIKDFVEYFRINHDMDNDTSEGFETNEYVMCMSCQDTYHEDESCANEDCESTQPASGTSSYFSSLIPEC